MDSFSDNLLKEQDISNGIKKNLELWNKLIKARILYNNSLVLSNYHNYQNLNHSELRQLHLETYKSIKILTKKLIKCQKMLYSSNKAEKLNMLSSLSTYEKTQSGNGLSSLSNILEVLFESFIPQKDHIVDSWDEKLHLSVNQSLPINLVNQIYKILEDPEGQLMQRTKIQRVIPNTDKGQQSSVVNPNLSSVTNLLPIQESGTQDESSNTIFDDHDFYYEIVKDFIDASKKNLKQLDENDETYGKKVHSGASKREIDTKSTKKRRIRYEIIPKLTNFMCPEVLADNEDNS